MLGENQIRQEEYQRLARKVAEEEKQILLLKQYGIERFESPDGKFLILPSNLASEADSTCNDLPCLKIK